MTSLRWALLAFKGLSSLLYASIRWPHITITNLRGTRVQTTAQCKYLRLFLLYILGKVGYSFSFAENWGWLTHPNIDPNVSSDNQCRLSANSCCSEVADVDGSGCRGGVGLQQVRGCAGLPWEASWWVGTKYFFALFVLSVNLFNL